MLKKFTIQILFMLFVCIVNAQTVQHEINYAASSLPQSTCNVFNEATSSQATIGGYKHIAIAGGASFAGSGFNLVLQSVQKIVNNGVVTQSSKGTAYQIIVPVKKDYIYSFTVRCLGSDGSGNNSTYPSIALYHSLNQPDPNTINPTACGAVTDNYWSGFLSNSFYHFTMTSSFDNYTSSSFTATATGTEYLIALVYDGSTTMNSAYISKIIINETPPSPSFALSSDNTSLTCGSTTSVTFTTKSTNVPAGATVSYTWNLGSSNNGWLYNGSAAPATIPTTTNTLTLTPSCGSALSSISATATVNGTDNYNTNTVSVAVTQPALSIDGASAICSGSSAYSITGLPCNASVNWNISSGSGIVSLSTNGNNATLTKTGNGSVTLIANINGVCGSNNITKNLSIYAGVPTNDGINFGVLTVPPYNQVCRNQNVLIGVISNSNATSQGVTGYIWQLGSWQSYITGYSNYLGYTNGAVNVNLSNNAPSQQIIAVSAVNACGGGAAPDRIIISPLAIVQGKMFYAINCGAYSLSASPNPATSMLNISVAKVDNNSSISTLSTSTATSETSSTQDLISNSSGITNMYLYDFYTNQLIKKWNYKENTSGTYNLNVSGVKRGIYVLKMERDNISATTKVILQ